MNQIISMNHDKVYTYGYWTFASYGAASMAKRLLKENINHQVELDKMVQPITSLNLFLIFGEEAE